MNKVVVIGEDELRLLQSYRRRWLLGWIAAGILALVVAFAFGQARIYKQAIAAVDRVHAEQVRDREAFVQAWETQQKTTDSVLEMGAILKQRQEQTEYNQMAVTDLTGKNKPWVKK